MLSNQVRRLLNDLQQAETELLQLRALLKADSTRESTRRAYDRAYDKAKKISAELYGFNT
jgi:hypothetical protein